jgi:4-hydroxyphenylpyruvate dioxygenase-like putative hemolysin
VGGIHLVLNAEPDSFARTFFDDHGVGRRHRIRGRRSDAALNRAMSRITDASTVASALTSRAARRSRA